MNSSNGHYYQFRGECYFRAKSVDLAISDLKQALRFEVEKKPAITPLERAIFENEKFEDFMKGAILISL